jgi:hypothetical protein
MAASLLSYEVYPISASVPRSIADLPAQRKPWILPVAVAA